MREKIKIALSYFLKIFLQLYLKTLFLEIRGEKHVRQALTQTPLIFSLWHDSLLLAPLLKWVSLNRPLHILISNSRDGEIPSLIATMFKNVFVVRVKHIARPKALIESCRLLRQGASLLITPDGPRGPRRVMKEGIHFASNKENIPIVFVTWEASKVYTLSSWDQFRIPRPFSKVILEFSEPVSSQKES